MSTMPVAAMILAAGLGTRMRPMTDHLPKPLVPVGGRPMIDYALDSIHSAGIGNIVVNVHHMADKVIEHLSHQPGPRPVISDESETLLDSGGGVVKALPLLGPGPFVILNADTFWLEDLAAERTNLQNLAAAWDPGTMDILLMTTRMDQIVGYDGGGDFLADEEGRLRRHDEQSDAPMVYPGVAIFNPAVFNAAPRGPFSLNACFDAAITRGRLYSVLAKGLWLTVGTPGAITQAEAAMSAYQSLPETGSVS